MKLIVIILITSFVLNCSTEQSKNEKSISDKTYYTIDPTQKSNYSTYTPPNYKNEPSSDRTYYTGKRGGCYYYGSSDKKVYVDKSLCR